MRPLLLVDSLPGVARWRAVLAVEPTERDWYTLADAIVRSLDHQSERSTDVRWLKLIIKMISGKLMLPESMRQRVEEVFALPIRHSLRRRGPNSVYQPAALLNSPCSTFPPRASLSR